jgi:hypothetical protein
MSADLIQIVIDIQRAAGVLMLLYAVRPRALGEQAIADALGINRRTARSHLAKLAEHNLVSRVGRYNGFTVSQPALLLVSGKGNLDHREGSEITLPAPDDVDREGSQITLPATGRVKRTRGTFRALNDLLINDDDDQNLKHRSSSIHHGAHARAAHPNPALLAALVDAGVGGAAAQLSRDEHLTVQHVQAHEALLRQQTQERYSPGLLVTVLRLAAQTKAPAPEMPDTRSESERRMEYFAQLARQYQQDGYDDC